MQEYGGGTPSKSGDFRDGVEGGERGQDNFQLQHQYRSHQNYGNNTYSIQGHVIIISLLTNL